MARARYLFPLAVFSVMLLGAILVIAVAALLQKPAPAAPPKPAVRWYYGKHTVAATGQKGVVVDCVERTNSVKFGNHQFAKPGDIYQFTCRAVRG